MYIKNLEIDNFKSFANKSEIPLLKGFTTVSGPNGSGKSTIVDAVLFALGLASAKELRAGNISQFITTHNNRNEAYVKVTFGDMENNQDISIARRIKKVSQGFASTYYINDSVTTLSNVHALLEKYNVTPNSYNVIMQGDVKGIVDCTAQTRRKIIDEIAGIADFDRRIEQATNELNGVEQRVERSSLILTEIEAILEQLKEEREVAIKYQKLREEKQGYESQVATVKFFDLKRNLEQAHENILEFTKKKKQEELKSKDLEERINLIRKKYEEVSAEVKEKGEEKQLELKKQEEALKGEIDRKTSAMNFAEKQILDNKKSAENALNSIDAFKKKIDDIRLNITLKIENAQRIEGQIKEKSEELKKILEDMTGLNSTAEQHIENRNRLRSELENYQEKENNILKEKYPLEGELKLLQESLAVTKKQIEELENMKKDFSSNFDLKNTLVEQLQQEMQDFRAIQQTSMQELDKINNEINDTDYNLRMAYGKLSKMEAAKQLAASTTNMAIDTVMNAKLRGVHAPLMQLGSVDKEYSTAMEIAFGGRMGHIVVDDEHVASVAIELLKSSRAGRTTFIPLNKMAKAPTKLALPKDKGVIDFAINLVDFDDEYINAFYYAVGDTIVVEDMECAKRLIGRYRMVTLAGELFEKSGAITGGTARKSGFTFSQNDDKELEDYKQKIKELEDKSKTLVSKKSTLERKLQEIRQQFSDCTSEHSKAKIELDNMTRNYENSEKILAEKKEFIATTEPKITELNKKLDKLEEKNLEVNDKILSLKSEIAEVEKLINEQDLKDLKEKTEGVEAEIKRLQNNLTNVQNERNDLEREIKFNEDLIKTRQDEIKIKEINNQKLENDKALFKSEIEKLTVQAEELKEQIEVIQDKLGELIARRDEIQKEITKLETDKHINSADIERISEQIESFRARRRELEPELENAKADLENSGVNVSKLEPVEMSIEEITAKIQRLDKKMNELGDVNMRALTSYDEKLARQTELKERIEVLTKERTEILERMNGYEQLKKETFMKTYNNLNENFKEVFHTLAEGEGHLSLEKPDSPFEGGMTIIANIRDKKAQRLEGLSGGEKAITALAFVFAIQQYAPAPFYAFDEVDANLDTFNVEKVAQMIKNQSNDTQFIVVSHRPPMVESAHRTIGVTQKEKGKTKVTGVINE